MKIEIHSPTIRRKEMDAVLTAMVEDQIGPGERSRLLVQTAREHLRFDYALTLRSPATALHLALKTLNLESGDGVLVSALSPRYYSQVLAELHLTPIFCDVSFTFPCMSRETIEKAIEAKPSNLTPRCIVLHHTLGYAPDTASIAEIGIPVIEDISQSYAPPPQQDGNESNPNEDANARQACGMFTILGLEERDMLTSGGGALLFAMNRKEGNLLRAYSNIPPEYCLPDINAALAAVQFRESAKNMARRNEIAQVFTKASLQTKHKRFIPIGNTEYNNYAFPLVLETGMKDVTSYARKKEIIVENAFEQSLAGSGISDSVLCPVSYSLSLRTVLFPLYPRLRSQDAQRVSKLIMPLP
jgi:dTDP-4-amino-4,6-dideoxygalactose transaminase